MAGRRVLGVLLAVAALLVAASVADGDGVGDDKTKGWTCFRSCTKDCHHHHHHHHRGNGSATAVDFATGGGGAKVSAGECKDGCQDDACFKDLPAISYKQCAIVTCLSHRSTKITACFKDCCEKCFRNSPPAPGPPKPGPPKPGPPAPGPPKPGPPAPGPPEPGPPEPEPGPPTPSPSPTPPSPPN